MKNSECIESKRYKDKGGYPRKYCPRRKGPITEVRFLYEQMHGVELRSDQLLLHSCDNPACINMDHIRVGTHQDNMDDRGERNRQPRGEKQGGSKLTEKQVRKILLSKDSQKNLAKRYGVIHQTISAIKTGDNWKHLQPKISEVAI